MGAEIIKAEGNVITARITGRLTEHELASLQRELAEIIELHGKVRVLALLEDYRGWHEGAWDNLSFQLEHDAEIERLAIVGDRKWKDAVLIFVGQGVRKFPIEFFGPAEQAKALAWLAEEMKQNTVESR